MTRYIYLAHPAPKRIVGPTFRTGKNHPGKNLSGEVAKVILPSEGAFDLSAYSEGAFDLSAYKDVMEAVIGVNTRYRILKEEILQTLKSWNPRWENFFVRLAERQKQSPGMNNGFGVVQEPDTLMSVLLMAPCGVPNMVSEVSKRVAKHTSHKNE